MYVYLPSAPFSITTNRSVVIGYSLIYLSILDCDRIATCNGHGSCSPTGTCHCDSGYDLSSCSQCAAGYVGYPNCVRMSPPSISPSFDFLLIVTTACSASTTCNNHGTCTSNGRCSCAPGFDASANCSVCLPDYYNLPSCTCKSHSFSHVPLLVNLC